MQYQHSNIDQESTDNGRPSKKRKKEDASTLNSAGSKKAGIARQRAPIVRCPPAQQAVPSANAACADQNDPIAGGDLGFEEDIIQHEDASTTIKEELLEDDQFSACSDDQAPEDNFYL